MNEMFYKKKSIKIDEIFFENESFGSWFHTLSEEKNDYLHLAIGRLIADFAIRARCLQLGGTSLKNCSRKKVHSKLIECS